VPADERSEGLRLNRETCMPLSIVRATNASKKWLFLEPDTRNTHEFCFADPLEGLEGALGRRRHRDIDWSHDSKFLPAGKTARAAH